MNQKSQKLTDILRRGANNFDLIRLVAAVAVIFGHSFYLFPTGGHREPVTLLVRNNFTGTLAVGTFFFISGMLVSQSFVRSKSPLRFALLRVARIYPGAIVALLLTVFVLGPLASSLSVAEYFHSSQTYRYLLSNWSFVRWPVPASGFAYALPGVFEKNVLPNATNGSLWTLYAEVVCYAYVLVLGLAGCLCTRGRLLATIAALVAIHALVPQWTPYFNEARYTDYNKVALAFLSGAAAYAVRDLLVIRGRYAVVLAALAAVLQFTPLHEYALYAALFYTVLVCAASPRLQWLRLPGDYSYGVYMYAWPVQQTVNQCFPALTSYPSNLICIPVSLLLGVLSWHFVESRCLAFARNLGAVRKESARHGDGQMPSAGV